LSTFPRGDPSGTWCFALTLESEKIILFWACPKKTTEARITVRKSLFLAKKKFTSANHVIKENPKWLFEIQFIRIYFNYLVSVLKSEIQSHVSIYDLLKKIIITHTKLD